MYSLSCDSWFVVNEQFSVTFYDQDSKFKYANFTPLEDLIYMLPVYSDHLI